MGGPKPTVAIVGLRPATDMAIESLDCASPHALTLTRQETLQDDDDRRSNIV